MIVDIRSKLNKFLGDRSTRFPKVTEQQKQEWIKSIEANISEMLDDNDVFYDSMPESVEMDEDVEDE